MSKKNGKELLNEGTIRHFMKLANLKPLSENFLDKLREDEDPEHEMDEIPPEEPMAEEPPMEEPKVGDENFVEELIDAIAGAIEGVSGVEVKVEKGEGEEEMPPEEEIPSSAEEELPPSEEEPLDEKCGKDHPIKENEQLPSGDRSEQSEDMRDIPAHDQIVEEEKVEEEKIEEDKNFGGTKDAKMKDAPKPKKVEESKKKLSKEQMIQEITKRVAKRLQKK